MSGLIITCAGCFHDYEPSHGDIIAGIKRWRLCPNCRPEYPELSEVIATCSVDDLMEAESPHGSDQGGQSAA